MYDQIVIDREYKDTFMKMEVNLRKLIRILRGVEVDTVYVRETFFKKCTRYIMCNHVITLQVFYILAGVVL